VTISTPVTVARLMVGGATGTQTLSVLGGTGTLAVSDSLIVQDSGVLVIGSDAGEGTVLSGGPVWIAGGAMLWGEGTIAGPGDIRNGGTLTIAAGNPATLDGRRLVNTVLLVFNGTSDLTLSNGASIENEVEATFAIQTDADVLQGTGAAGSIVNNFGFIEKLAPGAGVTSIGVAVTNNGGVLTVETGTMAFAGPTLTNGTLGLMRGNGGFDVTGTSFTNAGDIEAGLSPGQLGVLGAVTQQATASIRTELGGTQVATEYDRINVSGPVTLAGTLDITLINGYQPAAGDSLTVLTYASRSGAFAGVSGLDVGGGVRLDTVFTASELSLVARSTAQTATQLAFIVQPASAVAGATIAPSVQVEARDASGTRVTTFTGDVTLAISTNPGGGTLSGTTTVAAVNGVATFPDLSINNPGTGYRLQATSAA
jgi:hypothetical protein